MLFTYFQVQNNSFAIRGSNLTDLIMTMENGPRELEALIAEMNETTYDDSNQTICVFQAYGYFNPYELYCYLFILPFLCVLGVIFAAISIIVFTSKQMR